MTPSQIAQRIDELKSIQNKLSRTPDLSIIQKRIDDLTKQLDNKSFQQSVQFGVVPLPPDKIDIDNGSVVTPKAPGQVDRETEEWLKSLDS